MCKTSSKYRPSSSWQSTLTLLILSPPIQLKSKVKLWIQPCTAGRVSEALGRERSKQSCAGARMSVHQALEMSSLKRVCQGHKMDHEGSLWSKRLLIPVGKAFY